MNALCAPNFVTGFGGVIREIFRARGAWKLVLTE